MRSASVAIERIEPNAPLPEIRAVTAEAVKKLSDEYEARCVAEHHCKDCEHILECTIPLFELPSEERETGKHAVPETLAKLPVGCVAEMRRTEGAALVPYKARAEAARAADRHLEHVRDYVENSAEKAAKGT